MRLFSGCRFAVALALHAAAEIEICATCDAVDEVSSVSLLQVRTNSSSRGSRLSKVASEMASFSTPEGLFSTTSALKSAHPYYHTTAELQDEVRDLAKGCGGALRVDTAEDSGVKIDVVHVRAPKTTPINRAFILFGEHSRELISPESGLRFLQILCGKVGADGARDHLTVPDVLRDTEFQLVLNGNPRSRHEVEAGDYCKRTNPNGVDLNRNWDEKFDKQAMQGDTNAGDHPFSEPETRIFKKLVEAFRPTTFLTVHSGTRGLYMPWAYDMEHTAKFNAPHMLGILQYLDSEHCQCPFGAAGKEVGYPCPGTCLDWVYSKLRTPYVFAFEIYTDAERDAGLKERWNEKIRNGGASLLQSGSHLGHDHFADVFGRFSSDFVQRRSEEDSARIAADYCFPQFNPSTEETYNSTVQNWAVAYLEMAAKIAGELKQDKSLLTAFESTVTGE
jgi:hypothetical protein